MKAKNIVILHSGARFGGGVETYNINLFASYDHDKLNLTYMSLGEWPTCEAIRKLKEKVVVLPGNRFRIRTIFEISRNLKGNSIDLIVSQGTVANAYARAASLLTGVPNLVTVHSDPRYDYPNHIIRTIYTFIDILTRFPTKHYIAVSEYLKKKLVASGIRADKITVIYNGVSFNSKHKTQNTKPDNQQVVIGSIGRLHKVKNYAELIKACSSLDIDNWKLVIIGEGSERNNLERLIDNLGVGDRVQLLGNKDNIIEQLSQIDIYVQPSLAEGFGITVIEAMLAGKPVIVSPFGSLPEIVKDGKTGIVMAGANATDIAEAVASLATDKEKARQLAVAGQAYARKTFDINSWVQKIEKSYIEAAK